MKNIFVALEGIDGSGKSTQSKILCDQLTAYGHQVYGTFEPTDQPIGKMIRDIFTGKREGDQKVIAALFAADRLDHILHSDYGMLTKRNNGFSIVTDRYYLSSYAYHGAHVDMDWVMDMNAQATMLLKPDLHIYIDITPEVSLERIKRGRESVEMYETLENLSNVYEKYEEAFAKVKKAENIQRIDGDRAESQIAVDIWREVQKLF
jgi:dTMP kinase